MGGKNKQRTKNNARPSSSGRSAEILNNAAMLDSTFLSVGGGKIVPNLFPTLAAVTLDPNLNPEFAMCIKKLNKKDPITKHKALQELTELVNKSNVDEVEAALPTWTHFYRILSIDVDCKVREGTQACHGAIVRVCGRRIAPQLKRLLPAWLQAQYDEHAPAQALAQLSLKNTFPDNKLPEVVSFCKSEIMESISEGLRGAAGAAGVGGPEAGRTRAAALRILWWVARRAPPALDDWLHAALQPLLADQGVWRAAKDSDASVRAAWFAALGALVARSARRLDAAVGARLLRLALAPSQESEPRVQEQMWACLLLLMHHVPEWHTWLDKRDLLAKRIINVLENGGWGEARLLAGMLLPLLANLPPDTVSRDFYHNFFAAIFKGLERKNVLNSKSERQSWITGLAECLRYLSTQEDEYVTEVVTPVHRRWLERVLAGSAAEPLGEHLARHSAVCMAPLLRLWLSRALERNDSHYDHLSRNFWQNVSSTMLAQIDKPEADEDELVRLANRQTLFFQTLKKSFYREPTKRHIKFADDGREHESPAEAESKEPVESSPTTTEDESKDSSVENEIGKTEIESQNPESNNTLAEDETKAPGKTETESPSNESTKAEADVPSSVSRHFEHSLLSCAATVCSALITRACAARLPRVLTAAGSQAEETGVLGELAGGPRACCSRLLQPWLADERRDETVMDVVFLLLQYMDDGDRDDVYATFNESPVSIWALSRALSHPHVETPAARRWLRGPVAAAALAAAARQHCAAPSSHTARLLPRARRGTELLVHPAAMSAVLLQLSAALSPDVTDVTGRTARLVSTAAALCVELADHQLDDYHSLLLALFKLTLDTQHVSRAWWRAARAAWVDALLALPAQHRRAARADAARKLREHALASADNLNITKLEHLSSLCPYLLTDEESEPEHVVSLTRALSHSREPHHTTLVESHALRHDCIVGKLNCPFEDDNDVIKMVAADDHQELTKEALQVYLTRLLFRAMSLRSLLCSPPGEGEEEEERKEGEGRSSRCDVLLSSPDVQAEFDDVLREYAVLHSLHEGYQFWSHYDIIELGKSKLDAVISDIVGQTSPSVRTAVLSSLSQRAAAEGYYWPYAHRLYREKTGEDQPADIASLADTVTGNGFYHTLQANAWRSETETEADSEASLRTAYLVMSRSVQAALPVGHPAARLLPPLAAEGARDCGLDVMLDIYYQHQELLHTDRSMSSCSWRVASCSAATADYLRRWVSLRGWPAPAAHWDFVSLTLCGLLHSLADSTHLLLASASAGCVKTAMVCVSTLRLLLALQSFVRRLPRECERRQPSPHVAALLHEWHDVFAPAALDHSLALVVAMIEYPSPWMSCAATHVCDGLRAAVRDLPWSSQPAARAAVAAVAAAGLARTSPPAAKLLAHGLLLALAKPLVEADAEALESWTASADEEEQAQPRPVFLVELLGDHYSQLLELLDAALSHVTVFSASCELSPGSDAHSVALGTLLLTDALHAAISLARGELQLHYHRSARELPSLSLLLPAALRLLPPNVLAAATAEPGPAAAALTPEELSLFVTTQPESVQALACRAVYLALAGPGAAAARSWWTAAPPRASRALARLTRAAVTPVLLREQFKELQHAQKDIPDTEVTVHWSSLEVVAVHTVEDRPLALTLSFAREYPLVAPRVSAAGDCSWLHVLLAVRGGSLPRALQLWARAVDSRLARAPQCYVCYCRLHPASGLLPRMHCAQCDNRFHTACLRKWFISSNRSNCPLCRASF